MIFKKIVVDINQDSIINVLDLLIAVDLIFTIQFNDLVDMNSDNALDVLDIVILVDIILNGV